MKQFVFYLLSFLALFVLVGNVSAENQIKNENFICYDIPDDILKAEFPEIVEPVVIDIPSIEAYSNEGKLLSLPGDNLYKVAYGLRYIQSYQDNTYNNLAKETVKYKIAYGLRH